MADLGPEATATLQNFFGAGAGSGAGGGALPSAVAKSMVETAGLSAKDDVAMLKQIQTISENAAKAAKERAEAEKETQKAQEKQADEILDVILVKEKERHRLSSLIAVDMKELGATMIRDFAGGLSHAIVSAFEEGDKAFQKFAVNFMKAMAEMILQALILRAIQSFLGGGGQVGATGDFNSNRNVTNLAARGGFFPIMAANGVSDVSSPTFFPKFNVVAGEAGREVMTVLAKPRLVNFNGLSAQVGRAGNNRLAITSADALASRAGGGGAGGNVQVVISLTPGLKGEIVQASLENVTVHMQQDTTLSRTTKNLTK
jgi:hypothetical protein